MECSPNGVVGRRLATQRLTAAPLADPVDVVRLLLCVQAQDAPLARYSLGLRVAQSDDVSVRSAFDNGRLVRTHILRPTWHFVAAEDLRWILALTSDKVTASLSSRNRQLGIDPQMIERAHDELLAMLARRTFKTAAEISERFASMGLPERGELVRHLLLLAELRGLVCSGQPQGSVHAYGLVDEVIAPMPPVERDAATRQLVHRFFAGHGPASEHDLRRWTSLTLKEIRAALAELDDVLETETCDGSILWFDPAAVKTNPPRRRAALLPTFDEAYLPYQSVGVARSPGHPRGEQPHAFAEAGGGVVIVDRHDAGWWNRTNRGNKAMTIRLGLATSLDTEQRRLIETEAAELAAFFDRDASIELVDP